MGGVGSPRHPARGRPGARHGAPEPGAADRGEDPDDDRHDGEDDELAPRDREAHVERGQRFRHEDGQEDPEREPEGGEAGGVEAFDLSSAEIAMLASSHSGEDVHVRTLQGLFRRARLTQSLLACGAAGMPLDALPATRLTRDGEQPGPIRHMCSGQHAVFLLLSKLRGWDPDGYWNEDPPAQVAYRSSVARAYGVGPDALRRAIDGCGVPTYAFPLREVARAYAMLAEPASLAATDPRRALAPALTLIRDAMLANPELIGGTRDRLDTSLMKALPGRIVSKAGMEALRGVAILRGPRTTTRAVGPSGLAIKIEDGDGYDRGTWAASVEALRQTGVIDDGQLRILGRYHRPVDLDPHGREVAESVPDFELAPVGELVG